MKKIFCNFSYRKNVLILICLILTPVVFAENPNYAVSLIPAQLKENAHTVYRLSDHEIEIKSDRDAVETVTEAITIMNKNGEYNSYFKVLVNSTQDRIAFSGKVYDEFGKQVKVLTVDDIVDQSYIGGGNTYSDNRIEFLNPNYQTYPFTVVFKYKIAYKQTFFLPPWNLINSNISYESARYTVVTPSDFGLSYKEYNLGTTSLHKEEKGKNIIYSWVKEKIPAIQDEDFTDYTKPLYPKVSIAADKFSFKKTQGSMKSWSFFGKWNADLISDKGELPEQTVARLKELTVDCKTDFDKIKVVYEYMQRKTRYVSIQVGIGGFEPYSATEVDKTSYGDCKALSNYMKSLLAAVNIKSYYTLVNAGVSQDLIDVDFPSPQFNHVIVCVPLQNDTVWLECTSQQMPCGYIGDFTDDRPVLMIDGDNSKLIKTRSYDADANSIYRNYKVKLDDLLTGTAVLESDYKGIKYEEVLPIMYADNNLKEKMIIRTIKLPSFNLRKNSYVERKQLIPECKELLELDFSNYIRHLSDNAILLPLNFMNNTVDIPEKCRDRKTGVFVRRPEKEITQIEFVLPSGYKVSGANESKSIESKYGRYTYDVIVSDGRVVFKRYYELYKGEYNPAEYKEFRNFAEQVESADRIMVQLIAN